MWRGLCLIAVGAALLLNGAAQLGAATTDRAETASSADRAFCSKCHTREVEDIQAAGLAHKTAIGCKDCHPGHRPRSFENIPHCHKCHTGTAHYAQQQCLNCHVNPHRPRLIELPKKARDACLPCHPSAGEHNRQFPSYHSELVCTDCHHNHGFLPQCMSCHRSHAAGMKEASCRNCHAPHKPLELAFSGSLENDLCAACHAATQEQLEKSKRAHGRMDCMACHQSRHGHITPCQDCHGRPHPQAMLAKFPDCGACHGRAHDLE